MSNKEAPDTERKGSQAVLGRLRQLEGEYGEERGSGRERRGRMGKARETDVCDDFKRNKTKISLESENRRNVRSRKR